MVIKAGNTLLLFSCSVLLARTLGPEGYGVYSFILAILMLASIPAQIGVPQLIVRETAKAQAIGNYSLMRGLWRWGNIAVAAFSLLAFVGVAGVVVLTDIFPDDGARIDTLMAGLALIPLIALANVRGASLRGLRKTLQGQFPESIIRPGLLLLLVFIWVEWIKTKGGFEPDEAMGLYVAASIIAFATGRWMLRRHRPAQLAVRPIPEYQSSYWRRAIIPLALMAGIHLINVYADVIILGLLRPNEEIGIYKAVAQVASLVTFGLQAINQTLHPYFAKLHAEGDMRRLQILVTVSSRSIFVLASVPFFVFLFFGNDVLRILFGNPYAAGSSALIILASGQLFNSFISLAKSLLNMAGHERDTLRVVLFTVVVNVVFNFTLIPFLGIDGAAISTAISLLLGNVLLRNVAKRRLGVETMAFNFSSMVAK